MVKQSTVGISTPQTPASMIATISENRNWFMILGVLMVILGFVAILFPFATTIAAKIVLGWIFIISGVTQVWHAFSTQKWSQFALNLLIGVLYLVAGAWLAFLPLTGILTLTILLSALFIVEGFLESMMAFRMKPQEGWGWMLFAGLCALAAGILIMAKLPSSATWAIGLLVGINMISTGWAYTFLAMTVGKKTTSAAMSGRAM